MTSRLGPFAVLFGLTLVACGDDKLPPRPTTTTSSSSGSGGQGGAGGQGGTGGVGGIGGQGGTGGVGGQGGVGGSPPAPVCGDGNLNPEIGEECDDGNPDGVDLCDANCKLVTSETEPNNTPAQANTWSSPWGAQITPVGDVDVVSFNLPAAASLVVETRDTGDGACAKSEIDTFVEILGSNGATVLASDDDAGEGYCSRATLSLADAGLYYARVTAAPGLPNGTFPYRLVIDTITNTCGDGVRTPDEQCDDGGTTAGDGCSPTCKLELHESEPNNTTAQADPFTSGWQAVLSPVADADYVSVQVATNGATITAQTHDAGLGGCAMSTLDTIVTIFGAMGNELVTNDDALGYCSLAKAENVAAGTYFVRVTAGGRASDPSYYGLSVLVTTP
ncbi:MAG TPA: pre-peptidase C-terminal domain-containing protein [Polyangium sp.]|nr:pre-peptidase C-terminal domain-containing protein [Polyangium sp.]